MLLTENYYNTLVQIMNAVCSSTSVRRKARGIALPQKIKALKGRHKIKNPQPQSCSNFQFPGDPIRPSGVTLSALWGVYNFGGKQVSVQCCTFIYCRGKSATAKPVVSENNAGIVSFKNSGAL